MSIAKCRGAAGVALLLAAAATGQSASRSATTQMRPWGRLGEKVVQMVTLTNREGAYCRIASLGATVCEVWLPDRHGRLADVVLGFDGVEGYLGYGRCIGHHRPGGERAFEKAVWTVRKLWSDDGGAHVEMRWSPGGERTGTRGGAVAVVYSFTNERELVVEMTATGEGLALEELGVHGAWNLSGHAGGSVLDQYVEVRAARFVVAGASLEVADVAGTAFDLSSERRLRDSIGKLQEPGDGGRGGGFDVDYVVDGEAGGLRAAVIVYDPRSGRTMELQSDQPGVRLYTGTFLDGSMRGKGGAGYGEYQGVCIESRGSVGSRPGGEYRCCVVYRYGVRGS